MPKCIEQQLLLNTFWQNKLRLDRQTDRHIQAETDRQTHTGRDRQTDTYRQRQTDRHIQAETDRQTQRKTLERQTHRQMDRQKNISLQPQAPHVALYTSMYMYMYMYNAPPPLPLHPPCYMYLSPSLLSQSDGSVASLLEAQKACWYFKMCQV